MTRFLFTLAFLLGAAAVGWTAAIFMGADALALTVTLVIGGVYILGGVELHYFRQATGTLKTSLDELSKEVETLEPWLDTLAPALRNATQARIEGERVGLPAPIITPYLVGLLVMLGLLGTFVGMVETLQGAVMALEGNNELQAIRAGLAAPIAGLGLAFGTSVAGVSASAMLGLMSTLSRRERMMETRRLDQKISTTLRAFSLNHSRQETYRSLQSQADTLPAVANRLDSLAEKFEQMGERLGQVGGQLEQMGEQVGKDLVSNQQEMHQSVQSMFTELAASVENSLTKSVAESSRVTAQSGQLAGESLKPVMAQAVAEIQSELRSHSEQGQQQLQQQADKSYQKLDQATQQTLAQLVSSADATQQSLSECNAKAQQQLADATEQQLQSLSGRFGETAETVSKAWAQGLDAHQGANQQLVEQTGDSLKAFSQEFEQLSASLLQTFNSATQDWVALQQAGDEQRLAHWQASLSEGQQQASQQLVENAQQFNEQLKQQAGEQQQAVEQLLGRFQAVSTELSSQWHEAGDTHGSQQQQLAQTLQQSAQDINQNWQQVSKTMLEQMHQLMNSSEQLLNQRMESESHWLGDHRQRMTELSSVLGEQLKSLRQDEQDRGDTAVARLGELEQAVAGHLAGLGQSLEAPMSRLIETASEAPRAAAEVIEHLRGEISKNIERDNGLLSERRDVLVELNSLSESIQQTAAGQQQAIETLVSASTDKLQLIGEQFNQQVDTESNKLTEMVGLFAGSSAELSSLGEAFGVAVDLFRESNSEMVVNLSRIEASLTEAGGRSDEQLGYYVAQAREIIDHSVMSQQQMLDGLSQLRDTKSDG